MIKNEAGFIQTIRPPKQIDMNEITMPEYILDNAIDAIRLAANILKSRSRETAADRQIEYTERLLKWVKDGKKGKHPGWFPGK